MRGCRDDAHFSYTEFMGHAEFTPGIPQPFRSGHGKQAARAATASARLRCSVLAMNKPKIIPGFGLAIGLLVLLYTHLPESAQQVLAYVAVACVVAAIAWGLWGFRS